MNRAQDLLAPQTAMGAVVLKVADLDAMIRFYCDGVLLQLLALEGSRAVLGRGAVPVLVLEHEPSLRRAAPGSAGLFHTAVLFDTEADLAAALWSTATRYPGSFTGSADHLVSRAFYFDDPEGNGVELYWDRARSDWRWVDGRVQMDSLRLDPNAFVQQHLEEARLQAAADSRAVVGHVHLSVGDTATARDFYVETLGFEVTADLGSALFVSAGGYHHHMAMNVWRSRGAGLRAPALGLGQVHIEVPSDDDLGAAVERMRHRGVDVTHDGRTARFADPWGNRIELDVRPR
jgi:catechol 2,3-dioxygenase